MTFKLLSASLFIGLAFLLNSCISDPYKNENTNTLPKILWQQNIADDYQIVGLFLERLVYNDNVLSLSYKNGGERLSLLSGQTGEVK